MNKLLETDGLHNDPQQAKPMTGDRPGDQPVTPPPAVPELGGEFKKIEKRATEALDPEFWPTEYGPAYATVRFAFARLVSAHNRDMAEARKRIAELEAQAFAEANLLADIAKRSSEKTARIAAFKAKNARLQTERHGFRCTEAISIASAIAHRACCGTEHDPANGKIHGYCVVCGVPWPCDTAKSFMPPESILGDKEDA